MLCVKMSVVRAAEKYIMLSVVLLNVVMLSVMAPGRPTSLYPWSTVEKISHHITRSKVHLNVRLSCPIIQFSAIFKIIFLSILTYCAMQNRIFEMDM
jgi:hypothetical protein